MILFTPHPKLHSDRLSRGRTSRTHKLVQIGMLTAAALLLGMGRSAASAQSIEEQTSPAPLGQEGFRLQTLSVPSASPQSSEFGTRPTLSLGSQDVLALVPVTPFEAHMLWFSGIAVRNTQLGFSGFDAAIVPAFRNALYSRAVVVGFVDRLPGGQELFAISFISRNADDPTANVPLQAGGTLVWRLRDGPDSRLGWGVSASAEFGDPGLLPVFEYATWTPSWTVEMRLPFYAQARYWPTQHVSAGIQWLVEGGDYYVTAPGASVKDARFTVGTLNGLIAVGSRTGPELQLIAGQTVFERYQALRGNHSVVTVNFAPSSIYQAACVWRF